MAEIIVSAGVIRNEAGDFLLVRKRGTQAFMFPGGKPEAGESAEETLQRELQEELGLDCLEGGVEFYGRFSAEAANEAGCSLLADVFLVNSLPASSIEALSVASEIEELQWFSPSDIRDGAGRGVIAPLTGEVVVPALLGRGVLLFCGSALGVDASFADAVADLVDEVGRRDDYVVYGGGSAGLMGVIGDTASGRGESGRREDSNIRDTVGGDSRGGAVAFGVMPYLLAGVDRDSAMVCGGRAYVPPGVDGVAGEIAHSGLNRLELVDSMSQRKDRMKDLSDVIVALPGGVGTVDEFFDAWTGLQLGYHTKPIVLFNVGGFWSPLLAMVENMVEAGFLQQRFVDSLIVVSTPGELYEEIDRWVPPAAKWG